MPIEPPRKVTQTQIIRREEEAGFQQKKKQLKKEQPKNEPRKDGKIDIKV